MAGAELVRVEYLVETGADPTARTRGRARLPRSRGQGASGRRDGMGQARTRGAVGGTLATRSSGRRAQCARIGTRRDRRGDETRTRRSLLLGRGARGARVTHRRISTRRVPMPTEASSARSQSEPCRQVLAAEAKLTLAHRTHDRATINRGLVYADKALAIDKPAEASAHRSCSACRATVMRIGLRGNPPTRSSGIQVGRWKRAVVASGISTVPLPSQSPVNRIMQATSPSREGEVQRVKVPAVAHVDAECARRSFATRLNTHVASKSDLDVMTPGAVVVDALRCP